MSEQHEGAAPEGIAVIGMAGRFPGARSVEELWRVLEGGRETVRFFSDEELAAAGVSPATLRKPDYVRARGVLDDVEMFDAAFFGMTPAEAALTPPEYRLFLECAWEALEGCGYAGRGGRTGVFGGAGFNTYLLANVWPAMSSLGADAFQVILANARDHLATRVAYKLDLRGPALTLQTACSTSLVAVHYACQSLASGECDLAVAGGATVGVPQAVGYTYQEGGILAPDGHCRAFDARAGGTVPASGVGVVVLKRLEDALADGDPIDAVIRGSAVNNDGAGKVGYTAPGVDGQAAVIAEALAVAGVEPESVGYVETHGTGTALGDPIEVTALARAYGSGGARPGSCALGSLKSNLGHMDTAAGVGGLIKAVLALRHRRIPPTLHFQAPNPEMELARTPFYVNAELREWRTEGAPRRAGVSSFGMGGTNAHVVLEEAPAARTRPTRRPWHLLPLSTRTASALPAARAALGAALRGGGAPALADAAYTLQVGRQPFAHRLAVVCDTPEEGAAALEGSGPLRPAAGVAGAAPPPVVFLFPGQGAQHVDMGLELYRTEPAFRERVDRCAELLRPHLGLDLRTVLYPPEERREEAALRLRETALAQPALFTVEYALAGTWMEWGVRPRAMLGHSIGEYVAATLAGVFTLEDALGLVALRGRLMQELPPGAMLSVPLPAAETAALLGPGLDLAAENAPASCVVSGPGDAVDELEARLAARGVRARRLHTSHAFHSAMMEPALDAFAAAVGRVARRAPEIPFASNLTGAWITPEEAADPAYWAGHLRRTVRFAAGLRRLGEIPGVLLLEVGPGQTLCALVDEQEGAGAAAVPSMRAPREPAPDARVLLQAVAALWTAGVQVDWGGFWKHERRSRARLPTYPFERRRHWIEPPRRERGAAPAAAPAPAAPAPEPAEADGAALEWLVEEQLRLMSRQLELLRAGAEEDAAPDAAADVPAIPLTPVQHWLFEQERRAPHHFNQARLLELAEPVDPERLRRALAEVVAHHDALHTRYARGAGGWRALPGTPAEAFAVTVEDLAGLEPEAQDAEAERRAAAAQAALDPEAGLLVRAVLFGRGPARPQRLLLVVHHLAVDVFSWGVLLADLEVALGQLERGEPVALPPRTTPFREWAERLERHARSGALRGELELWSSAERSAARPLPRDHPGGRNSEASVLTATATLGAAESRLLEGAPRAFGAQVGEVLLAALGPALAEWAGGPVLVDVEGHGREDLFDDVDLSRTVGWFTSIFPVALPAARGPEAVARVRDRLRALPAGGIGWGLLRYLGGGEEEARLGALPRAEVSFNYLGRQPGGGGGRGGRFASAGGAVGPTSSPDDPRPHLLELVCGFAGDGLRVSIRYSGEVHRPATVQALAGSFLESLGALLRAGRPAAADPPRGTRTRTGRPLPAGESR